MGLLQKRRFPIAVNVVCFLIVLVVAAVFMLRPLHSLQRGFFCDDESIRFPYKGNTISTGLLIITCFIPAVVLVVVLETTYGVLGARMPGGMESAAAREKCQDGFKMGLGKAGLVVACLFFGNFLCFILTEIFKLSFGTLRPCFLSACQAKVDITSFPNCSGLYVEDIVCTNPDTEVLINMRKSFVSGHASFAVFNMFFIIVFLQLRLPSSTPRFLVSLLQSVALGYTIFVGATRIYDHYHHPTDVLGGSLLGVILCWVMVFRICPDFMRHPPRTEVDILPTTAPSVTTKQHQACSSSTTANKD